MRRNDLPDGTIKALLILALVIANAVLAVRHSERSAAPSNDRVALTGSVGLSQPQQRFTAIQRDPTTALGIRKR
jgi:hypothetical protein